MKTKMFTTFCKTREKKAFPGPSLNLNPIPIPFDHMDVLTSVVCDELL